MGWDAALGMGETDKQRSVAREFRKRQLVHFAIQGCAFPVLVIGLIVLIGFTRRLEDLALSPRTYWVGLLVLSIIAVLVLIQYFRNWRCPNCGAYLGAGSNPPHCSECGMKLRLEDSDKR